MTKKNSIFAVVAAVVCATASSSAYAVTILPGSTLNFAGQSNCSASGCSFGNAIVTSGSGSFSNFTFGTPTAFTPFSFGSFTPGVVYRTVPAGGQTASFFATARTNESIVRIDGLTGYSISDSGFAQLTGFEDTPGFFLFTANQNGALQGSFSATANVVGAVPEPATWMMMLAGFGAAGTMLRRRKTHAVQVRYV